MKGRIAATVAMWVAVAASIVPLVWLVSSSFKPVGEIFRMPPTLLPEQASLSNYTGLFEQYPFWDWTRNSLVAAVAGTIIAVALCSLAGYGFAMFRFPFRDLIFAVVVAAIAIPFLTYFVPLVRLASSLGIDSGVIALVLPYIGPPLGVFAMRQYIAQTIPMEVVEAARVDGAGEFRIFWSIVAPLIRPGAGAVAIWCFFTIYTSYMWPLAVVTREEELTLPVGVASLVLGFQPQFGFVVAGATLAAMPMIVLLIVLRRNFQSGLALGAVKG